jgi:hypothetical protein
MQAVECWGRGKLCGIGKLTLASFTSFPLRRFVLKTEDLCYTAIYVYKSNKFLKHQRVQPNILRCTTSTYCKQCTGDSVRETVFRIQIHNLARGRQILKTEKIDIWIRNTATVVRFSVADPDRVGSASFCQIRIGINFKQMKKLKY